MRAVSIEPQDKQMTHRKRGRSSTRNMLGSHSGHRTWPSGGRAVCGSQTRRWRAPKRLARRWGALGSLAAGSLNAGVREAAKTALSRP